MAQIRQEINITDTSYSATSSNVTANEIISIDKTKYNGTVSYYLEVEATNSTAADRSCTLFRGITTQVTVTVTASTASMTLFRSAAFTPDGDGADYTFRLNSNASGTLTIKSARIVVIQSAATLTNTETQIEIGNASSTTATVNTALTNPKYWKYTAANWDGTKTFYFESTFMSGTSKSAATMTLQESSSITAPSWTDVASSAITTTGTVATRVRSGAVTLTNGNWYRAVMKAGNSKSGITVYNAKVIVQQNGYVAKDTQALFAGGSVSVQGGTAGSGETNQAQGYSFTASSSYSLARITMVIPITGSPTDNLALSIYSGSINGTLLGTSNNLNLTGLSTGNRNFDFSTPVTITSGTKYYVQANRSGARDTGNYPQIQTDTSNIYPNGGAYTKSNNAWGAETGTSDGIFTNYAIELTKLEPQYLLANTLLAAGTSLQTFLTKWDSTEWSGVTNTYYFQAETADGSTSDVELWEAGGGGSGLGVLTNIDNAQISSAVTMPTSQDMDIKATTNAGDVAAARILVATVVDTNTALLPSVSDSTTVSDTPTILIPEYKPLVSDSTTVGESVTMQIVSYINVGDATTVSESITTASISVFSTSDSTTVGESVSLTVSAPKINVADSTTVTDTPTLFIPVLTIQVVDQTTVSESQTISPSAPANALISVSDSTTVTDTPSVYITTLFLSVSDSTTVTDTATFGGTLSINVSDSTTVTDTPTLSLTSYISVTDSTTTTDAIQIQEIYFISVSDSTTVTDTPNLQTITTISVSDTVTMNDVAGRFDDVAYVFEQVTIAIQAAANNLLPSVSDTVTVGESVQMQVVSYINVTDSTTVTDTPTIFLPYYTLSVVDQTTVTDAPTLSITSYINVSDPTTVTDTPTIFLPYYTLSVADSTTVSELVALSVQSYLSVSDGTTVSDTPTLQVVSALSVADSVTVGESVQMQIVSYINVSDPTTVSDTVTLRSFSNINVADTTTISESVTVTVSAPQINVSDSTTVADTPSIFIPVLTIQVVDQTTVTDTPTILIPTLTLSVADSITTGENVNLLLVTPGAISVADTTTVSDTASVFLPYLTINVSDLVTTTDTATLTVSAPQINVSDSTTVNDTVNIAVQAAVNRGFSFVVIID